MQLDIRRGGGHAGDGLPETSSRSCRARLIALLAFLAGSCGASEGNGGPASAQARPAIEAPVLIFGIDGFEWAVALPLIAAGRMPTLEGLMQRGVAGTLRTLRPTLSPRVWTTIATGKLPEQHGILGFVKGEGAGALQYTSFDRKAKAFWNILTDHGVSSATLGWWMTFPAEEVLGFMVSQTKTAGGGQGVKKGALLQGVNGQVFPSADEEHVLGMVAEVELSLPELERRVFGSFFEDLQGPRLERWRQCEWAFRADSVYARVLEDRLEQGLSSDVTALYLGGTDVVGHRFWAAHDPESLGLDPASEEVRVFGHVIEAYYEYTDRTMGDVLARFPRETTVFVVSDHGMTAMVELVQQGLTDEALNERSGHHMKGEPGIFVAAGTGILPAPTRVPVRELAPTDLPSLGSVSDFCPTLLTLLGIPHGEDMHGRPMLGVLDPRHLERHPLRRIPTHDDAEWLRSRDRTLVLEESAERVRQLEQLGYLGDDEEDPKQ